MQVSHCIRELLLFGNIFSLAAADPLFHSNLQMEPQVELLAAFSSTSTSASVSASASAF